MKIINYNEETRKIIKDMYDNYIESIYTSGDDIINLFKYIKKTNSSSKYIAGIMIATSYLCYNYECEYNNKKTKSLEKISMYEQIDDVEDYIKTMSYKEFLDLCYDTYSFENTDYEFKNNCIGKAKNKTKTILKIFPCYIFDLVYYNFFSCDVLLSQYDEFYQIFNNKPETLENTTFYASEKLIELYDSNFENYKWTILDIFEEYYKYNKYLILNNKKVNHDVKQNIIDMEDDLFSTINFCGNSSYLLEPILKSYINYMIDDNKKSKTEKFFYDEDNRKQLSKFYKNVNKIKYNV